MTGQKKGKAGKRDSYFVQTTSRQIDVWKNYLKVLEKYGDLSKNLSKSYIFGEVAVLSKYSEHRVAMIIRKFLKMSSEELNKLMINE